MHWLTTALLAIVLLTACDLPGISPRPQNGGTLNVAISGDPSSLNRFLAADPSALRASAPLFPLLYQANPDMTISPDLASAIPILRADQQPRGTGGPFKFEKRTKDEVDLVANPDYYTGRPHLDRMVFKIIPDPSAAASAVANGDIGWEPDLMSSAVDKLKGSSGVQVFEYPDLSYYDVRFNDRPDHLFGDKLVRQAFAYAIDKEAITRRVSGGHGVSLWGDLAPESWAFDPVAVAKYKPDLARAQQLMQSAGWSTGSDGIAAKAGKRFSTSVYVRSDAPARAMAVGIIAEQARAIGMDLRPAPVPFYNPTDKTTFFHPLTNGPHPIPFTQSPPR